MNAVTLAVAGLPTVQGSLPACQNVHGSDLCRTRHDVVTDRGHFHRTPSTVSGTISRHCFDRCRRRFALLRHWFVHRHGGVRQERAGIREPRLSADDVFGGLFFPLPRSVQPVEFASPAFYLQKLGLAVARTPSLDQLAIGPTGPSSYGSPILSVAVLVVLTLLFTALAVRRLARVG